MQLVAQVLVLLSFIKLSAAVFRTTCPVFTHAYMDPIVAPGARSGHEHSIAGSLGFSDQISAAQMLAAQTTCSISEDKSAYWFPSLYRTDTGARMIPIAQAYYMNEHPPVNEINVLTTNINMIVGTSLGGAAASLDNINFLVREAGVNDGRPQDSGRFGFKMNGNRVYEVRIDYLFPSCWNGGPYTASQSHMAYP
ncbi:unnamed protein product, partial [Phaeothamnion confervicola]